ncbi:MULTISPECIES: hypothetical protein [Nostocales]|uniref:Uncharacterized protein n=3 Tax=Nostocales TaxID=1161 RepID=A0A8S9TAW8_9CYAN|nr:hypothetical protein [Tolypothrix bouteillei]KAF3889268.1 hypothetical protein DA73_0400030135 [Tolypothrix bouteillei VB521301]
MAKLCPVYKDSYALVMLVLEESHQVSRAIGTALAIQAQKEGLADLVADAEKAIKEAMWEPKYTPIIMKPLLC